MLLADAAHRWSLLKSPKADHSNFKFIAGTDEHGSKIQAAATSAGLPFQQYVDQNSQKFQECFHKFGIINTDFIRTTEDRHKKAVLSFWVRVTFLMLSHNFLFLQDTLKSNGHIEKGNYEGWY